MVIYTVKVLISDYGVTGSYKQADKKNNTTALIKRAIQHYMVSHQGPVSPKARKVFGPVKPFLDHLYLKMEKCIRLKLPV